MENDDTAFVSTPLVRQYSDKLAQEGRKDTMSLALVAAVKHEEDTEQADKNNIQDWNGWLFNVGSSKTTTESRLEQQKQVVVEEWKKLASSHHFKITADNSIQGIPTIDDLWKSVTSAESLWQDKSLTGFHKLRDRFCSFAGAMGNYSYLFQIIPSGDKYFSLVTGVVSSMIKISANYHKAAEALSEGLMGLGTSLTYVGNELSISSTEKMQDYVVELYTEVFTFLCQAFEWFSSKSYRLKTALNDKYVTKKINQMVTRITQIVSNIRYEAEQSSRSKINSLTTGMMHLEDKIDKLKIMNDDTLLQLRLISHQREQDPIDLKELLNIVLGRFASSTLQAVEQHTLQDFDSFRPIEKSASTQFVRSRDNSLEPFRSAPDTAESHAPVDSSSTDIYNRYDIERFTSSLHQYIENGRHSLLSMQKTMPRAGLSPEVLHTMGNWIKATETTFLYIEGYAPPGAPSILSVAAMQLCDIALDTKLPCVSFFCQSRPKSKKISDLTDKQAGLIALLYSIMLQLIQLLPTEFRTSTDFTKSRFDQFSGAFSMVSEALKVIGNLMEQLDVMIHWILDGINLIEDRDTRPYILELIEVLRKKGQQTPCKVCFTTNGNSLVLNRALKVTERMKEHISFTTVPGRLNYGVDAGAFRHMMSKPPPSTQGVRK